MTLLLHPKTQLQLTALVRAPKGAYLFSGPDGMGRRQAALWLARQWCCGETPGCSRCHLITEGNHPDVQALAPEAGGSLGIEAIQQLVETLGRRASEGTSRRVVIIDGADRLTTEAQNSFLKALEEPPLDTTIILLSLRPEALLETIRSRCETVEFLPLSAQVVAEAVIAAGGDRTQADELAGLSGGAPGLALRLLADAGALDSYRELALSLKSAAAGTEFDRLLLAQSLQERLPDPMLLIRLIQQHITSGLRQAGMTDALGAGVRMSRALEHYERYRQANVNGRAALSYLLLSL